MLKMYNTDFETNVTVETKEYKKGIGLIWYHRQKMKFMKYAII